MGFICLALCVCGVKLEDAAAKTMFCEACRTSGGKLDHITRKVADALGYMKEMQQTE